MNQSDTVPFVDLRPQHQRIMPEMESAFRSIVDQNAFIYGPAYHAFEKAFADYHKAPYAVGCASGTDALLLAARALDLGHGDEVITVANTWIATVTAISYCGAKPVFVDIDPRTHQIDVAAVEAAITPRTKAVFAVHLYGHPFNITALAALCKKNSIALIEDVAQATIARYDNQLCGTVGDVGCFSFYPTKNLGALGDAGAVITNNRQLEYRMRRLANYGQDPRFTHHELGYNSRLDTIQAAYLLAKLPHLAAWTEERRRLAYRYNEMLKGLDVVTPYEDPKAYAVYHLYVIEVDQRDACHDYLRENGILVQIHYPNMVHQQPCYQDLGYKLGSLPVMERLNKRILSLPIFPGLTESQQDRVVDTLKNFFKTRK